MGAVVLNDVPPNSVIVGNPGRRLVRPRARPPARPPGNEGDGPEQEGISER